MTPGSSCAPSPRSRRSLPAGRPGPPGHPGDEFRRARADPWAQAAPPGAGAPLAATAVQALPPAWHPEPPPAAGYPPARCPPAPDDAAARRHPAASGRRAPATRYDASIVPGLAGRPPAPPPPDAGLIPGLPGSGTATSAARTSAAGPDAGRRRLLPVGQPHAGGGRARARARTTSRASGGGSAAARSRDCSAGCSAAGSSTSLAGLAAVVLIGVLVWWQSAGKYTTVPRGRRDAAATAQHALHNAGLHAKIGQPSSATRWPRAVSSAPARPSAPGSARAPR